MKKSIIVAAVISVLAAWAVQAEDAKALYDKQCAKCHGEDGKGETKMGKKLGAKDYTDPKVQDALKDDAAVKAIKGRTQERRQNPDEACRRLDRRPNQRACRLYANLQEMKRPNGVMKCWSSGGKGCSNTAAPRA